MKNNKHFCILPWVHLLARPEGGVAPCCSWKYDDFIGSLKDSTLKEIAMSAPMNEIRRKMLNNEQIPECYNCNIVENPEVITTLRQRSNQFFSHIMDELIDGTNPDGSLKSEFILRDFYLKFSNLCNFKCRTCGPKSSSLIADEHNKAYGNSIPIVSRISDFNDQYLQEVFTYLPYAEKFTFAGGESLLIPEHWAILDELVRINNINPYITYITNLSKLTHSGKNIIEYSKKFTRFKFLGSLDAYGPRAELYRNGTIWPHVEKSLRAIKDANCTIDIYSTIGALNIMHAPDLQKYLIENELISSSTQFRPAALVTSPILSSKVLPTEYKIKVTAKIIEHINWLTNRGIDPDSWKVLMNFMNSEDHSHLFDDFVKFHKNKDKLRGENTGETFPELNLYFAN